MDTFGLARGSLDGASGTIRVLTTCHPLSLPASEGDLLGQAEENLSDAPRVMHRRDQNSTAGEPCRLGAH